MNRASETYGTTINGLLFVSWDPERGGKQIGAEKVLEKIWVKISQIWKRHKPTVQQAVSTTNQP